MKPYVRMIFVLAIACLMFAPRAARAQLPNPYGQAIGVEAARKVAAAAIAECKKNNWNVAVAVVDTNGELVFFERMDGAQVASVEVSQAKARTAARFKRPSKAFEDAVAGGRVSILALPGVTPIDGGLPLVADGKIVGAVGTSGVMSPQDAQCSAAGAETLGKQPGPPHPPTPPAPPPPPPKK